MINSLRQRRDLILKRYSKPVIYEEIANMLKNYTIMFMYFGGSIAYDSYDENISDTDINVFVDGFDGYIHTSCADFDLFITARNTWWKDSWQIPQWVSITGYLSMINAGAMTRSFILIQGIKKNTTSSLIYDITASLPKYLETVYNYFMFLYIDSNEPLKRFYHVIRIRKQLESYKETGKYDTTIPNSYKSEMLKFKKNYSGVVGKEIYRNKIGDYLEDIKALKEELENDSNWNSTDIY